VSSLINPSERGEGSGLQSTQSVANAYAVIERWEMRHRAIRKSPVATLRRARVDRFSCLISAALADRHSAALAEPLGAESAGLADDCAAGGARRELTNRGYRVTGPSRSPPARPLIRAIARPSPAAFRSADNNSRWRRVGTSRRRTPPEHATPLSSKFRAVCSHQDLGRGPTGVSEFGGCHYFFANQTRRQ
jgi:hypothetical protein